MAIQDDRFQNHFDAIKQGQRSYFEEYGRAWQGILSHGDLPQGGTEAAADNWNEAPSDQGLPWSEALPEFGLDLDKNWTQAIRIDTWSTKHKEGYTVTRKWLDSSGEEVERTHEVTLEDNTPGPGALPDYQTVWVKASTQADFNGAMKEVGLAHEEEIDGEPTLLYDNGVHWIGEFYSDPPTYDEQEEAFTGGTLDGRKVGAIRTEDPSVLEGLSGITVLDAKPAGDLPVFE